MLSGQEEPVLLHGLKEGLVPCHDEVGQKHLLKLRLFEVDEGDLRLKPGLADAPGNPLGLLSPSCSVASVFPCFFAAPEFLIDARHLCRQPEGKLLSVALDLKEDVGDCAVAILNGNSRCSIL